MPDRERAVSEVISFTLVFSLIAVTVGVVYVGGIGNLEDVRNDEQVDNAERAFDVLDDNLADIARHGAPNRGTELKLAGAQLSYGSVTELNVTTASGGSDEPYAVGLRPIVYESETGTRLIYEAGAIVREERGGGVVTSDPPILFGQDQTLIQYVQTRKIGESPASVGGQQTVLIRGSLAGRVVLAGRDGGVTATFNVTTDRPDLWESTLETKIEDAGVGARSDSCQIHGDTVVCKFDTDTLYVTVTRIDVSFS